MTIGKSALQTQVKTVLRDWRLFFILAVVAPVLLIGLWLAFDVTVGIALLILGIAFLAFSAKKAVEHSVSIASALGMSPLMTGLIVVSLGTDFPEGMGGGVGIGDGVGEGCGVGGGGIGSSEKSTQMSTSSLGYAHNW